MTLLFAFLIWLLQLVNPEQGDRLRELTPAPYVVEEDGSGTFPGYHEL